MKTRYRNAIAGGVLIFIGITLTLSMFECADWYVRNIQSQLLIGFIITVALASLCVGVILLSASDDP